MRPLTAIELLNVWERGMIQNLVQKSLNLLSVACPDMDFDSIASLSIGERDARLLLLRAWMFGSRLKNMADCPKCAGRIEWENDITDICLQQVKKDQSQQEYHMEQDEFDIHFRLPNNFDILSVIAEGAAKTDPVKLLTKCIIQAQSKGKKCKAVDLPEKVIRALNQRMEIEDPQANIHMLLNCPYCSYQWEVNFDIISYLWKEIDNWAQHLLQDIHILASEYGWSEHDILEMSPVRRQIYLGMVK